MVIKVQGGTNAGRRVIKAKARDWTCPSCGARNKYYWTNCPVCSHPRPEES